MLKKDILDLLMITKGVNSNFDTDQIQQKYDFAMINILYIS